jgi:hypothetical protein
MLPYRLSARQPRRFLRCLRHIPGTLRGIGISQEHPHGFVVEGGERVVCFEGRRQCVHVNGVWRVAPSWQRAPRCTAGSVGLCPFSGSLAAHCFCYYGRRRRWAHRRLRFIGLAMSLVLQGREIV